MSHRLRKFLPILALGVAFVYLAGSTSAEVVLTETFSNTQGQNGLRYLAVGDSRPGNTSNPGSGFSPLTFAGTTSIPNGSVTNTGPAFVGAGDILPYVLKDETRNLLLLHPESLGSGALGAGLEYAFPNAGRFRVSGQFARANDARNAGNGVDVAIYRNRDLNGSLFAGSITSNHVVDPEDVFGGTAVSSFDFEIDATAGDQLLFAVFADQLGQDQAFDVTALRGSITAVPEPSGITFLAVAVTFMFVSKRRSRLPPF